MIQRNLFRGFIFFICFLFYNQVLAQRKNDAVHLKNGSIIRGKLVESVDSTTVSIQSGNNLWVFEKSEIEIVQKEFISMNPKMVRSNKYETDFMASLHGVGSRFYLGLSISQGMYLHTDKLLAAVGVGFEYYEWGVFPLVADVRYYPFSRKKTPFIGFRSGYSFSFEPKYEEWGTLYKRKGGSTYDISFGIRNNFRERSAVLLSVGFKHQYLEQVRQNNITLHELYVTQYNYNHISFNFGIIF